MTVSSVAVAESTSAGWPANVTALASGSGRKPRPLKHDPVADRAARRAHLGDEGQAADVEVERPRRRRARLEDEGGLRALGQGHRRDRHPRALGGRLDGGRRDAADLRGERLALEALTPHEDDLAGQGHVGLEPGGLRRGLHGDVDGLRAAALRLHDDRHPGLHAGGHHDLERGRAGRGDLGLRRAEEDRVAGRVAGEVLPGESDVLSRFYAVGRDRGHLGRRPAQEEEPDEPRHGGEARGPPRIGTIGIDGSEKDRIGACADGRPLPFAVARGRRLRGGPQRRELESAGGSAARSTGIEGSSVW